MEKVSAVILAGKQGKSPFEGVENKALIKIHNKPMVEYIIDALRGSERIGKIAVVGSKDELSPLLGDKVDYIIEGNSRVTDNGLRGVEHFNGERRVLIITSDIPLITGKAIADFIDNCEASGADLCYPIVTKECCIDRYPDAKRTYTTIKEGTFTGGNAFYINPSIARKCHDLFTHLTENRKNTLKMAGVLGPRIILEFIFKRLSISTVEKRVSKLIGIKAKAIVSQYPEIGNDVDKPEDIVMAEKYLA